MRRKIGMRRDTVKLAIPIRTLMSLDESPPFITLLASRCQCSGRVAAAYQLRVNSESRSADRYD